MAKQKIEIEIDIMAGHEFVRLHTGVHPDLEDDELVDWRELINGVWHFVVVRPIWKWPEWLTAGWIAMDKDGRWNAFHKKPYVPDGDAVEWMVGDGSENYIALNPRYINFVSPQCDDWRKSLRRNPNK